MRTASRLLTSSFGSAFAAVVVTTALTVALTFLLANVAGAYGLTLFLGVPFSLGLISSVVYGWEQPRDIGECVMVAVIAVVIGSLAVMAVALEGAICLIMAAPITLGLAVAGALVGHRIQRHGPPRPPVVGAFLMLAPALFGGETLRAPEPPLRSVTTQVVVDAPPDVVWRHVVAVDRLPKPRELVFRVGIAYPTQATIEGTGVGAIRRCTFTTGDFVEPITVWRPGRRLEFRVASQPEPMKELSPYRKVNAPHLQSFLVSERGRFDLRPLPGGRTLLVGTTWYRNRMWPQRYWGLWSDALVHRIHGRVLRHIAARAEAHRSNKGFTSDVGFSFQAGNRFESVSAVAYDLRRTNGFLVADSRGRVLGKVESPMYGTRPDAPDALAVRKGFFARRRHLVPADAIHEIDRGSGVIELRVPRESIRSFL
jgi:hypothetical protein